MTTAKHTPGPWGCIYTSNHAHDYRLTKVDNQHLPVNADGNDHSEQRATARLIAAAPDMLEALKHVRNDLPYLQQWSGDEIAKWVFPIIDAAIALAEERG